MIWHPLFATMETHEHMQNAIVELEKAMYQAQLDYITGADNRLRIALAIEILKGSRDDLIT